MEKKAIAKKIIRAAVIVGCLLSAQPAKAFVWPVTDLSQIAVFVNNINVGITKITNATNQVKNATQTIKSLGDQVASARKYITDLRNNLAKIQDNVTKIVVNVKETADNLQTKEEEYLETEKTNAQNTVDTVNEQVDEGASEEEVQEVITAAKEDSEANRQAFIAELDNAGNAISSSLNNANQEIDNLIEAVNEYKELEAGEKQEVIKEAEQLKSNIEELKAKATAIIAEAKENYNAEYSKYAIAAFDAYSQAVSDYYAGKISREDLRDAGEAFKDSINSLSAVIDSTAVNELVSAAQEVADSIAALNENILNLADGQKDYSDDEELEKNVENHYFLQKKIYGFNFHRIKTNIFAKSVYSTQDKSFLLSQELQCKNLDISKIEESTEQFRDCVVRAKTEKEYFCPEDPDAASCNPFAEELYKNYKKDGVYKHILEDYSNANIVNISKIKQYTSTWGDAEKDTSTLAILIKTLTDVKDTRAAYQLMGMVDIEQPRLWSELRRIDAVHRAKEIVKRFQQSGSLYIDGRDEEYASAIKEKRGEVTVENQKKQIFPHVLLYKCDIKAEDISVSVEDKHESNEVTAAENKIVDCLFKYAEAAGRGTIDGKEIYKADRKRAQDEWSTKRDKAINDSAFQTLALAVINNYKSSKDYEQPSNDETNIVSLQEGLKNSTVARDDYSAGAQINYYTTQQILSIIDADAQSLQTEIIKDLKTFGYNYFDKETGGS